MGDPRFYAVGGPFALGQLAEIAGAAIAADADARRRFIDVAPLEAAGPEHVSFLDNKRYVDAFACTRAGACLVHPDWAARAPRATALLLMAQPYHGYARVARAFHPEPELVPGTAPSAVVDPSAEVGPGCRVEAGAVVGAGARLGPGCRIGANAVIGDGVVLGEGCVVGPCASLAYALVGRKVIIHAGARIAAQSGVMRDVPAGEIVAGSPAMPTRQHWRQVALLAGLARKGAGKGK